VVARWEWADGPGGNVAHVRIHRVRPAECEQAVTDPRRVRVPAYPGRTGEPRWGVVGATAAGRVLRVIFTVRRVGGRLAYHVVTAHDAAPAERRGYPSGRRGAPPR
jgi:uncharacterized DUF497 family protein